MMQGSNDSGFKEYPPETLARLQSIELEMLKILDRIFEEHGLRYFIDGGTCLGAVRHKGFIPWDDDIDIAMPLDDYKRFRAIAASILPEGYSVHDCSNTPGCPLFWMKLYKDGTRFLEPGFEFEQGIFIDIFPFIVLDQNPKQAAKQRKHVKFWQRMAYLREVATPNLGRNTPHRKLLLAGCKLAHHTVARLWSVEQMRKKCERWFVAKDPGHLMVNGCSGLAEPFELEWIFPTQRVAFDEIMVNAPNNTDEYLKAIYGDYMRLPAPEDRHVHTPLLLDFGDGVNALEAKNYQRPNNAI